VRIVVLDGGGLGGVEGRAAVRRVGLEEVEERGDGVGEVVES